MTDIDRLAEKMLELLSSKPETENDPGLLAICKIHAHYVLSLIQPLREALNWVKRDCEICDWNCESCSQENDMKESDIYYFVTKALATLEKEIGGKE